MYYVPLFGDPCKGKVAFVRYEDAIKFATHLGHHLVDNDWGQRVTAALCDDKGEPIFNERTTD